MTDRVSLGRIAMRSALQLRRALSIPREAPVNMYDVATALGIEVRFVDHPSMEGMFYRGPHPVILLPSWTHRPKGRIAYSCAHEVGHFQLGHGTRVDEYLADRRNHAPESDEEFAADTFAASLLMPRQAVLARFMRRTWDVDVATPLQLFIVAGELDVGYETLLNHLCFSLDLVDHDWLAARRKVTPKVIRQTISGSREALRTMMVDEHWPGGPIDLEVGDLIAFPRGLSVVGNGVVASVGSQGEYVFWSGIRAGEADLHVGDHRLRVRVARAGYCGLLKYRFLDDPDDP